jgi:hypothetical protein
LLSGCVDLHERKRGVRKERREEQKEQEDKRKTGKEIKNKRELEK